MRFLLDASARARRGWSPQARGVALGVAILISPMAVRFLQMAESDLVPVLADGRGVMADLGTSLLFASVLSAISRWPAVGRILSATLAGFWSLVHFANYEHIRELGSVINPANAGYLIDPTFFQGSVLSPTHPVLMLSVTAGAMVLAAIAANPIASHHAWKLAVFAGFILAVTLLLPVAGGIASWRQTDPFIVAAERLFSVSSAGKTSDRSEMSGLVEYDMNGTPILAESARPRNVLLIILEGTSGAFVPSLRDRHGATSTITMPGLDRIAQGGLAYSSFITTQRQTNRGEYALLCGDYPKLTSAEAKMSELVGTGPIPCLPRVLTQLGFTTTYLQAAPLPFMFKDQFMAQAGFARVLGNAWFETAHHRNHWGVDDRTLFEGARDVIADLERDDRPWFLTLLTVGTHHRYNVPPDFRGHHEPGSQAWAFEYLDGAVATFIDDLASSGVLDNTVVFITSDESQATQAGGPDWANARLQAWGLLIVLTPSRDRATVDQVFTQSDLPASVIDLLHPEGLGTTFLGRSVFRHYENPRPVFWGNTHLRTVAGLNTSGRLTICSDDFTRCTTSTVTEGELFAPDLETRASTAEEIEWLGDAVARSLGSRPGESRRQIVLIGSEPQPVLRISGSQYVFGGQFLTVPGHARIDVEITARLEGVSGWIDFAHNFIVAQRPVLTWSDRMRVGETLRLKYTVGTEYRLSDVESRMWVTASEGQNLRLRFLSATLAIEVLDPSVPVPKTAVDTFEISRR